MATQQIRGIAWTTCIGRDGGSNPYEIAADQAEEVVNMEFTDALGKKRDGCTQTAATFPNGVFALAVHFPSQTSADAWLISVTTTAGVRGLIIYDAGPGTPVTVNPPDVMDPTTPLEYSTFVTHAGQVYWAYDSALNRLHVIRPNIHLPVIPVRRVGVAAPPAPAVTNTGVGTYPATLRYYRVQWLSSPGTVYDMRSNLGPPTPFTPSGVGLAARITMPIVPTNEEITHWQVYGSADNLAYYRLSDPLGVFSVGFFDDTRNPATDYPLLELAPLEGANTPFPSVKYLASDGRHLFGFGVWETTAGDSLLPSPGRVYFTPAIGTSDTGDNERVSNTLEIRGWIDMTPYGGAVDRGISGPINNRIYVFQNRGIYVLVPTGDEVTPFARVVLSTTYGSTSQWSQVLGEDEQGQPALYFLDPRDGPRRIANGSVIQWLGHDVTDLWKLVNHESTGPAFGIYDQVNKLVKWWVPTGVSNSPDLCLVYDVRRGRILGNQQEVRAGWSLWTGLLASARCGTMYFADWHLLKTTATAKFVPYIGLTNNSLVRQDRLTITDMGTVFQAFIRSGFFTGGNLRRRKRILESMLLAKSGSAFIAQRITKDFGEAAVEALLSIQATGGASRVRVFYDATDIADYVVIQVVLGDKDLTVANQTWELDQWHGGEELEAGAR